MSSAAGLRQPLQVGLGEVKVSDNPEDSLAAMGLGSCVAVAMYDSQRQVGGMAHILLPEDRTHTGQGAAAAVSLLVEEMRRLGADTARSWVKIAGGAAMLPGALTADYRNIGARNVESVKRSMAHHGLCLRGEDTGGNASRMVELEIKSGRLLVRRAGEKPREL